MAMNVYKLAKMLKPIHDGLAPLAPTGLADPVFSLSPGQANVNVPIKYET